MTDIVTRIRIYGMGQENLGRQIMRGAEAEAAAYWGDDPTLPDAVRQDRAAQRQKILANAEARARPMLERAAEARKDPPLLLRRPDVEGRDPSLYSHFNPEFGRLYKDAVLANMWTQEMTAPVEAGGTA
jgi:hypothetical protein